MEEKGRIETGGGAISRLCIVMIGSFGQRNFPVCDGPSLFWHSNSTLISYSGMDLSSSEPSAETTNAGAVLP